MAAIIPAFLAGIPAFSGPECLKTTSATLSEHSPPAEALTTQVVTLEDFMKGLTETDRALISDETALAKSELHLLKLLLEATEKARARGQNASALAEKANTILSEFWFTQEDLIQDVTIATLAQMSGDHQKVDALRVKISKLMDKDIRDQLNLPGGMRELRDRLGLPGDQKILFPSPYEQPPQVTQAPKTGKSPTTLIPKQWITRLAETAEKRWVARDPWTFTPEQEDRFRAVANDTSLPEEKKSRALFDELTKARLENVSPVSRRLIRRALDDALKQKSIYSQSLGNVLGMMGGPHYNPVFNRVYIPFKNTDSIADLLVAFHEIEHLFHRNTSPLLALSLPFGIKDFMSIVGTPITPLVRYRMESRAMGAQWEMARRIPKERRLALIRELREKDPDADRLFVSSPSAANTLNQAMRKITIASLEHADLSKEEFLKKLAEAHGYSAKNLLTGQYRLGYWKAALLALSVDPIYQVLANDGDPEKVVANDLKLVMKLYSYLFAAGGPANQKPKK